MNIRIEVLLSLLPWSLLGVCWMQSRMRRLKRNLKCLAGKCNGGFRGAAGAKNRPCFYMKLTCNKRD